MTRWKLIRILLWDSLAANLTCAGTMYLFSVQLYMGGLSSFILSVVLSGLIGSLTFYKLSMKV